MYRYVRSCVYMSGCIDLCVQVYVCGCIDLCAQVRMCEYILCIDMYAQVCMCVDVLIFVLKCVCVWMC